MIDLLTKIQALEEKYRGMIVPSSQTCYEFKFLKDKIYVPFCPRDVGSCIVTEIPKYCQLESGLLVPKKLADSLKLNYTSPMNSKVAIWHADDLEGYN